MRIRTLTFLAIFALVVAACSGGTAGEDATTTTQAAETTTTLDAPEAMKLSYELEPGTSHTYEVTMNQQIDMAAEGNGAALGEEDIPEDMSVGVVGTTTFTYEVSEGPEPDTFEIHITGDFGDLEFSGTVDGEDFTGEELPDFAEMEPVDVTVVVDSQGNVIPDESGLGDDFFGDLGGLDMLENLGSGAGGGQFVGPPFSDEDVTVGDTWSETIEVPGMAGGDMFTTQIDNVVTATETIDGAETFVIETTTTTSAIEFDLAEFFLGFMFAFLPEDASDEEVAEMEELAEQIKFLFNIDETTTDLTTWFDPGLGLARQADFANETHLVMDIAMPDEESGELVEFSMDMTIDQDISYRLVEDSAGA